MGIPNIVREMLLNIDDVEVPPFQEPSKWGYKTI